MRILLADDQKDVCTLTQRQLERRGHSVVAVCNGEDALRALQQGPFDAVVLDEEMPGMTGAQVAAAIRVAENQASRKIVIALTGYSSEPDKERLLKAGFDAVLGKPFRMEILDATLRQMASGGVALGAASGPSLPAQDPPADPLARVGGDAKLLARMAQSFLDDLPARLAKLQKSLAQKDSETLAFDAHALKGSLSIFAADQAATLCKELQLHAKSARFADAARTFAALKEAIAELQANLRGYAEQKRTTAPGAPATSKIKHRPPDAQ
jgi:CheY-like chemotaxis protein